MNSGSFRAAGNSSQWLYWEALQYLQSQTCPSFKYHCVSACLSDPLKVWKAGTLQQKMLSSPQHPSTIRQSILQMLNEFGSEVFFLIHHIHPISCQQDPIFSKHLHTLYRERDSIASRMQKKLLKSLPRTKVHVILECYRKKQT